MRLGRESVSFLLLLLLSSLKNWSEDFELKESCAEERLRNLETLAMIIKVDDALLKEDAILKGPQPTTAPPLLPWTEKEFEATLKLLPVAAAPAAVQGQTPQPQPGGRLLTKQRRHPPSPHNLAASSLAVPSLPPLRKKRHSEKSTRISC